MWIRTLRERLYKVVSMSLIQSTNPLPVNRSQLPVVVVLGSTATGKSKLAIDLALKFGGEVISADSMQVYKGLDILTNKATTEEMKDVPHHMIGIVDRKAKFDVVHFRDQALPLVENILKAGKIPFIVGGTNYYIESILWQILIGNPVELKSKKRKAEENSEAVADLTNPIIALLQSRGGCVEEGALGGWTNQELHAALQLEDPERASRLHPNDRRKVIRSLQVRFQTGKKHSELIAEQCSPLECDDERESTLTMNHIFSQRTLGGSLRFPNSVCLWIQAEKEVLDKRIEDRVEKMITLGLKQELDSYIDILREEQSCDLNYEKGILQSIGFKEFHSYLQLSPNDRNTEQSEKLFRDGVDRLKTVTKQYARKQLKWITQRFLVPHRRQVPQVYKLDGNFIDPENWECRVLNPAFTILNACLQNKLDEPILELARCTTLGNSHDLVARICETCGNRVFIGNMQYQAHMKSAKHKKMQKRKLKNDSAEGTF